MEQSKIWEQFFNDKLPYQNLQDVNKTIKTTIISKPKQNLEKVVENIPVEEPIFLRPLVDTDIKNTVNFMIENAIQNRIQDREIRRNPPQATIKKSQPPVTSKISIAFDYNMNNFTKVTNIQQKILTLVMQLRMNLNELKASKCIGKVADKIIYKPSSTKTELFLKNFIKNFLIKIKILVSLSYFKNKQIYQKNPLQD